MCFLTCTTRLKELQDLPGFIISKQNFDNIQ